MLELPVRTLEMLVFLSFVALHGIVPVTALLSTRMFLTVFFFINFRPFVRRAGGAQGLPPHPELSRAQAFSQLAKSVRPQSELGRCQLSFVG